MNPTHSSPQKDGQPQKSVLRENTEAILVAIVLALFIRTFVIQAFKIPSGSMKETLQVGDHLLVNKFVYGIRLPFSNKIIIPIKSPQRGDIVVFEFPEDKDKDFIKRVIGVPGDVIEIRNKAVYVNHELFEIPQAIHKDSGIIRPSPNCGYKPGDGCRDNLGPITVPPDSFFMMGDNRDHSYDSRFWGFANMRAVRGKALIIYWSFDSENFAGGLEWLTWWKQMRWGRIGTLLK